MTHFTDTESFTSPQCLWGDLRALMWTFAARTEDRTTLLAFEWVAQVCQQPHTAGFAQARWVQRVQKITLNSVNRPLAPYIVAESHERAIVCGYALGLRDSISNDDVEAVLRTYPVEHVAGQYTRAAFLMLSVAYASIWLMLHGIASGEFPKPRYPWSLIRARLEYKQAIVCAVLFGALVKVNADAFEREAQQHPLVQRSLAGQQTLLRTSKSPMVEYY